MFLAVDVDVIEDEQVVDCNQPDTEDGFGCENEDEDGVAMVEEAKPGLGNVLCEFLESLFTVCR